MAHIFEYAQKYEQCPTDNLPCVHPFFWYLLQPGFYIPSQQGPLPEEVLQAQQRSSFFWGCWKISGPSSLSHSLKMGDWFRGRGPGAWGKRWENPLISIPAIYTSSWDVGSYDKILSRWGVLEGAFFFSSVAHWQTRSHTCDLMNLVCLVQPDQ